ncbi:MAG: hypothetical protein H0V44_17700 [Planctomycetes bacterium]|nr:hypothetical protein [Planctomycetota bacterium]
MNRLLSPTLAFVCLAAFTVAPVARAAETAAPAVVSYVKVLSDKVPDVSNLEAWKKSFITDGMTDHEKAVAVWKTVSSFQHQDGPPAEYLQHEDLVYDPIKIFNVYGYAMCCNASAHVNALSRYLGYPARGWAVHHHSICEIEYGNAWHHFDSSLISYFPKADGSVASIAELTAGVLAWYKEHPDSFDGKHGIDKKLREFEFQDGRTGWKKGPEVLSRAPTYNHKGWWPAGTHGWYATMQVFDGTSGDVPAYIYEYGASQGYQVNVQMRRGERLERNWSHKGLHVNMLDGNGGPGCMEDTNGFLKRYDASFGGSLAPGRVGNGTHTYVAPIAGGAFLDAALASDNIAVDAASPKVRAKSAGKPASFVLRMPSSYVYLGGELALTTAIGKDGGVMVSISDNNGLDWKEVAKVTAVGEQKIDVKKFVGRRYDYRLKFELTGAGTGIDALSISHDIQHSQRPLPALDQGANTISFSTGPAEGTITVEANTRTDHAGKQVLYTDFHPKVERMSGSPLKVEGSDGSITFPIATPGDMTRLRFGGHYQCEGENDTWDFQVSFDDGKTFTSIGTGPGQARGRTAWTSTSEVPKGTRAALVRYVGKKVAGNLLWSFRIDADYLEPKGGSAPVKVTYRWEEDGQAKEDVHMASKASDTWTITCGAKPLMKSIVIERE